jgi:glutaredoxin
MKCKDCKYCKYNPATTDYICGIKLPPWTWMGHTKRINIEFGECDLGKEDKPLLRKLYADPPSMKDSTMNSAA